MNNEQINNTSYYLLPCGRYLEDFIWFKQLDFATGSALKYFWRAGHKDGESFSKDYRKASHYIIFLAKHGCVDESSVEAEIKALYDEALIWDGKEVA